MLKKILIHTLLITMLSMVIIGCGIRQEENQQDEDEEIIEEPVTERDYAKEMLNQMSIDEKIGQLVILGIEGYRMDERAKAIIQENSVGGVILFGRNVENSQQLLSLINALKAANADKIPLFLSVDEEGGIVSRLPKELNKLPTSRRVGDKNNEEAAYKIGEAIGEAVKSFGYNMNFAPVLDINSNPQNPVIGDRSYGPNAAVVSNIGVGVMKGLQRRGVIPVVKHFPGHGDTAVDSHISLPVVNKTLEALMGMELIPFTEAIKQGAEAVMVAHIQYNKIDSEKPATLSKTILTDILRKQLGFDGVIITDDLTMGAIVENHGIGEAAITSINAGSDILLVCHGYENGDKVLQALKGAVEEGIISETRLDESVYRILSLKLKYDLNNAEVPSVDIKKINAEINAAVKGLN